MDSDSKLEVVALKEMVLLLRGGVMFLLLRRRSFYEDCTVGAKMATIKGRQTWGNRENINRIRM